MYFDVGRGINKSTIPRSPGKPHPVQHIWSWLLFENRFFSTFSPLSPFFFSSKQSAGKAPLQSREGLITGEGNRSGSVKNIPRFPRNEQGEEKSSRSKFKRETTILRFSTIHERSRRFVVSPPPFQTSHLFDTKRNPFPRYDLHPRKKRKKRKIK